MKPRDQMSTLNLQRPDFTLRPHYTPTPFNQTTLTGTMQTTVFHSGLSVCLQSFAAHRGYPPCLPVCRLTEGHEPPSFKMAFFEWRDRVVEKTQLSRSYSVGNIGKVFSVQISRCCWFFPMFIHHCVRLLCFIVCHVPPTDPVGQGSELGDGM